MPHHRAALLYKQSHLGTRARWRRADRNQEAGGGGGGGEHFDAELPRRRRAGFEELCVRWYNEGLVECHRSDETGLAIGMLRAYGYGYAKLKHGDTVEVESTNTPLPSQSHKHKDNDNNSDRPSNNKATDQKCGNSVDCATF